jgi:LPXTG-motif cell wall-anchored protein
MIHNHSSGKHRLWRKILAVCIAFAMICSVSISAFAVEASSETANENTETVQSGSAEEAEELTATEAENDQSVDESQSEEPAVTTGDENTEEPIDVIEAPSEDPEQPEEPSVEPSEDNEQPAEPTVTEQPEEPTVTEQPKEPAATPAGDADASVDEVQDVELEAQADAQTVQDIELEQDPVAVQERWNFKKKAAIYYLANPAGDPWTNDTGAWAPTEETSNTLGTIDIENAKWEDGYVGNTVYKEKNIKENVSNHITSWPDGSTGTTWTVKSGNTTTGSYFTFILDSIWENYKKAISEDTGININNLDKSDILEITLTPRKISRDNGGKYPYHIDCALSIKSRSAFTAKFWVKNPNDTEYTQVDAKNYKTGDSVIKTEQGENEKVIDGITYVLDGWYPENDGGGACGDQKITTWPHRPTDPELADGTVNFYAHYIPLYTTVNIKKIVTGNMGDKSKAFHFKVSVVNGNINLPFNIGATQYSGSADITLSDNQTTMVTKVPVGATVTITENDYSGSRYTTSYTIGGSDSTIGNTAEISNIQQLNEDENTAHEVTFTNNKDAIPDTGLDLNTTPYILALGIVAAGAGVLLFRRRKLWS